VTALNTIKFIPASEQSKISQNWEKISHKLKMDFPRGIKKVLLINPPDLDMVQFNLSLARNKRYWNYPPYGLLVLGAALERSGIEVEVINLQDFILQTVNEVDSVDELTAKSELTLKISEELEKYFLKKGKSPPDLVGVTCMFSLTHESFLSTLNLVADISTSVLCIGGVHVSNAYADQTTRTSFCDAVKNASYIFPKEADTSLLNFVSIVNKLGDSSIHDFSGFAIRLGANFIDFESAPPPDTEALNVIPAFHLSPPTKLSKVGRIGTFESLLPKNTPIATALMNRGCRAECTFCSVRNFNGKGVRSKNVASVIEELKVLRFEHDIRHIMWLDDDLLYDRSSSYSLFNEMVRAKLDMTWDTTNGVIAASVTEEMMSAAADSGCIGIILGMESGNSEILKRIKKPGNVRHFLRAAEALRKFPSINTRVFLMLGFPGETFGMISDTYNIANEMDLDWSNINILQPLPNTPIFNEMLAANLIDAENSEFSKMSFSLGASGKLSGRRESGKDMLADNFEEAFSRKGSSEVPTKQDLDDLWAYMNYHLNFEKLERATIREKISIQYKWLDSICQVLAPNNAFARYYRCVLDEKLSGNVSIDNVTSLKQILNTQDYWVARFNEFNIESQKFDKYLKAN
jgi:radical SAM superfamily enzyme YgiQ (UPF0313 family)